MIRRWEALLRIEPVGTPLGNPDVLVHLIPATIDAVLTAVARRRIGALSLATARALPRPRCTCDTNPYHAFFKAGEQAMTEELVVAQSEAPDHSRRDDELASLIAAFRQLAFREIETFCEVGRRECEACPRETAASRGWC